MKTTKQSPEKNLRTQLLRLVGARSLLEISDLRTTFPKYWKADVARALRDYIPSLGLRTELKGFAGVGRYDRCWQDLEDLLGEHKHTRFGWVETQRLEVGPKIFEEFPGDAAYLVKGGPCRMLIQPIEFSSWTTLLCVIKRSPEAIRWAREFLEGFRAWVHRTSCYRTHMIRVSQVEAQTALCFLKPSTRVEIDLPSELTRELDRGFLSFRRHRNVLEGLGIQSRRGLLLCGEPGTGKTATCRYLKRQLPDHTFLLVDSDGLRCLRDVFQVAKSLAPAVVVIEEVDLIARSREVDGGSLLLNDLLNLLDGLEDRDDVGLVLTTNLWGALEKALVDRPGRIDQVIIYGLPSDEQRWQLVRSYSQRLRFTADRALVGEQTRGMTPAQIREVVNRAVTLSLERAGSADWDQVVTNGDVVGAAAAVRGRPLARPVRPIGMVSHLPGTGTGPVQLG